MSFLRSNDILIVYSKSILPCQSLFLGKPNVWTELFPALEHLCLSWPYPDPTVSPSEFLGCPALASRRLRYIDLEGVSLPTLPQLLLSSRDLIRLYLGQDVLTGDGFLSPADLPTALSAAARLELLHVYLPPDMFHKEQEEQGSTDSTLLSSNLVVLPALPVSNAVVLLSTWYTSFPGFMHLFLKGSGLTSPGDLPNPRISRDYPSLSPVQNA